jgi:2-(1,2-epoxy-1,2-dihydrophenyl)acetyl-CoA isomerase
MPYHIEGYGYYGQVACTGVFYMTDKEVFVELSRNVMTIYFNRPLRRNSLTVDAAVLLHSALLAASADGTLKILVLRGYGDDFCCGADINTAMSDDCEEHGGQYRDPRPYEIARLLYNLPAVTIAAIRGGCAGAAIGWAAACDFRLASETAKFNTAFLTVGMAGDMAGVWFMTRLVGATRARDLFFLPRKFGAAEALDLGFLTRTVPDQHFDGALSEMVTRLSASAPLALKAMKANFNDAERLDLDAYVIRETERHQTLYGTEDRVEAFSAFIEKREPHFTGR